MEKFTYDITKLKFLDRNEKDYRKEHDKITADAEATKAMFTRETFNRHMFNNAFVELKKSQIEHDLPLTEPSGLAYESVSSYGSAVDCGKTRVDEPVPGMSDYTRAFNNHSNPKDYCSSFIEKCKKQPDVEKPLIKSEISSRIEAYRNLDTTIPKNSSVASQDRPPILKDILAAHSYKDDASRHYTPKQPYDNIQFIKEESFKKDTFSPDIRPARREKQEIEIEKPERGYKQQFGPDDYRFYVKDNEDKKPFKHYIDFDQTKEIIKVKKPNKDCPVYKKHQLKDSSQCSQASQASQAYHRHSDKESAERLERVELLKIIKRQEKQIKKLTDKKAD